MKIWGIGSTCGSRLVVKAVYFLKTFFNLKFRTSKSKLKHWDLVKLPLTNKRKRFSYKRDRNGQTLNLNTLYNTVTKFALLVDFIMIVWTPKPTHNIYNFVPC